MVNSDNFISRVLSSIVIFFLFAFTVYSGGISFYLLIFSISVLSSFEWYNLTKGNKVLYIFALLLIALPNASLIYLYSLSYGKHILIWLILTIWGIDVTAYLFGKNFGGAKICSVISPSKTWHGLFGAILAGILFTFCASLFFGIFSILYSPIIGFVIAIMAQLGDFTESAIKRIYKIKDSSNIIPGHGGILDRMDGFIFTAPIVVIYLNDFYNYI
ncbi:phosphatidate cytidylyltransferase [Wolbachia endosymbiont of Pentidionis agamae]|uniref:phosphatidate cytidylyltransferase n=1 Tax=Wolbachia endosymbiont of Pentidionis agamae TaxID=3110435 RepID=UPI002FD04212